MKSIGVVTNREKDQNLKYTKILVESILEMGGNIKIVSDIAEELGINGGYADETEALYASDIVVCLGGDGTFLKAARKIYDRNIPMLGINLGNLGFLTEVEKSEIRLAVENIMQDKYEIEERMMLEATISDGTKFIARDYALNDVVIARGVLARILHLKTYVNNAFVDTFPGDGLIISSPTGSTAYSLAAGGPIVEPDVEMIIVNPICPHILYTRSYVTTGSGVVKVVVNEDYCHEAAVTVDGQKGYEIRGSYVIEIKKAPYTIKLISVKSRNFFHVLRTKIFDRGESLRKDEV
ncbi:MAG: NAD(+)/NADH kinase [Clostridia bacterium]|nr:NAD(+)/NADH kinase [Clostridia bacterium]